MNRDFSEGWDEIAEEFITARKNIGADFVRNWAKDNLQASATILDIGCGSGIPIAQALFEEGFTISGIDASPKMINAFRTYFPDARTCCEPIQQSSFFDETFDAIIAIGLLFLLNEEDQIKVIKQVSASLKPDGYLLFSAPYKPCEWSDSLTGRISKSLGQEGYQQIFLDSGLKLINCRLDEGDNNYFQVQKSIL